VWWEKKWRGILSKHFSDEPVIQELLEKIHNLSGLLTGISVSVSCCLSADTLEVSKPFLSNLSSLVVEAQNELKIIRDKVRQMDTLLPSDT